MLSLILFLSLTSELPNGIEDIQVGDCLTFDDMQVLIGVHTKDLYLGGECGVPYELDVGITQTGLCQDPLLTASWSREMAEHDKWGMWWPGSPPCQVSVTKSEFAAHFVERLNPLSLDEAGQPILPACLPEDFYVATVQTEKMETKLFEVGTGEMYLPNPLVVHKELYTLNPELGVQPSDCFDRKLVVEYTGWGKFKSYWRETACAQEAPRICRNAKMKADETDSGDTCVRITAIEECQK